MAGIERKDFGLICKGLIHIESGELSGAEVLDALVSIQTVVNDLVRKAEQPDRYPAAFNIKKSAGPDA